MQTADWLAAVFGLAAVLASLIYTAVRRRREGRRRGGGRCAGCPFAGADCRGESSRCEKKSGRNGPARGSRRD